MRVCVSVCLSVHVSVRVSICQSVCQCACLPVSASAYLNLTVVGETRGVGGVFFDDLEDENPEKLLKFVSDMGAAVVPSYFPLGLYVCLSVYVCVCVGAAVVPSYFPLGLCPCVFLSLYVSACV